MASAFARFLFPSIFPLRNRASSSSSPLISSSSEQQQSPSAPSSTTTTATPSSSIRLAQVAPDVIRCKNCGADLALASQIVSKGFMGLHGRAMLVMPMPPPPQTTRPAPAPAPTPSSCSSWRSRSRGQRHVSESSTSEDSSSGAADGDDRDWEAATQDATLLNISMGPCDSRMFMTGRHVVADVWCALCNTKLGWKYVDTEVVAQLYKVGMFVLERERVVIYTSWDDVAVEEGADKAAVEEKVDKAVAAHAEAPKDDGGDGDDDDYDDKDDTTLVPFDSDNEEECEEIFLGTWDAQRTLNRREQRRAARDLLPSDS